MVDIIRMKKGDTKPVFAVTLQYSNETAIDLTNGSVWFHMGNFNDYSPYYSGLATITGSDTGLCEYRWEGTTDTGSAGIYWAEFKIDWGNGSVMTLPSNHNLKIEISEDYE